MQYGDTREARAQALLRFQRMAGMQNAMIGGALATTMAAPSAAAELERAQTNAFIARNIGHVREDLDANAKRAWEAERALAAERVARLKAEAERDAMRLQVDQHRPEFVRALIGPVMRRPTGPVYLPNTLWLVTSIALIAAGVWVML